MTVPFVGRRGRVLLFFGLLDMVYAASLAAPDAESSAGAMLTWLARVAPLWGWSLMWGVTGVICVASAFRRRDFPGYAAATLLKVFWGGVCLGGWIFGGVERGYVSAAIWLGLAYLLLRVLAPWPEPNDMKGPTWTRRS